ncbi:hypothetical protein [Photobacterium galatheae]|nr:hypothetical protein [Photobacterium galatheae]
MWLIAKTAGVSFAKSAMHYVAPVGEKEDTVNHCLSVIEPYLE